MHCIYKTISADRLTPTIVFKKLSGIALLESAVLDMGKSRYSFIVLEASSRLSLTEQGIVETIQGESHLLDTAPHKYLELVAQRGLQITVNALPFPLPARGVGYLSYEFCRFCDTIELTDKPATILLPEASFIFGTTFVVFDHYRDELQVVAIATQNESIETLQNKISVLIERLEDFDFRAYVQDTKVYEATANIHEHKREYLQGVETIKQEIIKGNLVQGVLSQQIIVNSELPAFEAYRRLRRENPSPYLFYLDFDDFQLLGASPEIMVQVAEDTVLIKPIAGTRPRGKTQTEDIALEKELLADEKERAEHLMLIDLARNDLGRFAVPGSVKVTKSFFVERYAYVMHIVSEVEAKKLTTTTFVDIIKSVFPAGTVSGAPKIQAIETISNLEPVRRGPYAGLVGYVDINGNFDSCITIRSVVHKGEQFLVQAGAGIVYDSIPEKEYLETLNKAQATIRALGVKL